MQKIISSKDDYKELDEWIRISGINRLMLVCGESIKYQKELIRHLKESENSINVRITQFSDFQPNPLYENVVEGVKVFRNNDCDGIMAVGGGSAMDVAKCIKLYQGMEGDGSDGGFLAQKFIMDDIPFLAMPTIAGSGSEATRYAVIYYKGRKQSITSESFLPETVLIDPDCLMTLPLYQKKSALMDALCHAMESFWSVNSTDESREYSRQAIKLILENINEYLSDNPSVKCCKNMLFAANTAGKAINITKTTAGHAMCYKITSLFGVAHGHAAILCNRILFSWMIDNVDKCIDQRGPEYLKQTFNELGQALGCCDAKAGSEKIDSLFEELEFSVPLASKEQFAVLRTSVNPDRLRNNPIALDEAALDMLYHRICNSKGD